MIWLERDSTCTIWRWLDSSITLKGSCSRSSSSSTSLSRCKSGRKTCRIIPASSNIIWLVEIKKSQIHRNKCLMMRSSLTMTLSPPHSQPSIAPNVEKRSSSKIQAFKRREIILEHLETCRRFSRLINSMKIPCRQTRPFYLFCQQLRMQNISSSELSNLKYMPDYLPNFFGKYSQTAP